MKFSTAFFLLAGMACAESPTTTTSVTTETVVDIFLGAKRSKPYIFDGSIITADATATTYEIHCESGTLNLPGFPTTTSLDGHPRPFHNDRIEARTAAYCNYTFIESLGGTSTTTSYTTVITGDSYTEYPIGITAGLQNLPTATNATQVSTPTSPVPTSAGSIKSVGGSFTVMALAAMLLLS
ncbi:hypothetical protein ONZ43_g2092 [Nemania bipapillata]|uniref:Uncharacterized protein n=1 Tax=Nemania bipapillata TaxID=110536 RepID=A0ACC2J1V7_9PEZI|nr:hypothetical protein ONZ43_g2092 [Nemania bipapillata]